MVTLEGRALAAAEAYFDRLESSADFPQVAKAPPERRLFLGIVFADGWLEGRRDQGGIAAAYAFAAEALRQIADSADADDHTSVRLGGIARDALAHAEERRKQG